MHKFLPNFDGNVDSFGSSFIPLPVVLNKKSKKKCCKKFKKGHRCKKCPGQRFDK